MIEINPNQLHVESFVDGFVTKVSCDVDNKIMSIDINGGDLETGEFIKNVNILIKNWEEFNIYEVNKSGVRKISKLPIDYLSLYKFYYDGKELRFVDAGNHSEINWVFLNPTILISAEMDLD